MIAGLKPYAEYKDSGIPNVGLVPHHFEIRRLRNVADLLVSSIDKHSHKTETPVRLCNYLDVYRNEVINSRLPFQKATALEGEITRFRLKVGDVVLTKDSESWLDIAVPALVAYEAPDLVYGYHLAILRPRPGLSGSYLLRVMQCFGVSTQFHVCANGITRYGLSHDAIKSVMMPWPPIEDQTGIARFLNWSGKRFERVIRAKRKVITLLNEQRQAIIGRAVTQDHKDEITSQTATVWCLVPLKQVVEIQSGLTLGKRYSGSEELVRMPYLRVANVQAGSLNLTNVKRVSTSQADARRTTLQAGDVLMTEGGDPDKLGRGCMWKGEVLGCLHQNHVFAVRPRRTSLLPEYLSLVLDSAYARNYFQTNAKQTTNLASTNRSTIGRFRIPLPTVPEQKLLLKQITDAVEPLEKEAGLLKREITLLREYQTRLIADVVTGKLDVREAAARLSSDDLAEEPLDSASALALEPDVALEDQDLTGEELAHVE